MRHRHTGRQIESTSDNSKNSVRTCQLILAFFKAGQAIMTLACRDCTGVLWLLLPDRGYAAAGLPARAAIFPHIMTEGKTSGLEMSCLQFCVCHPDFGS